MGISAPFNPMWIAGAIPLFVMGAHDGHNRIGKAHAFQNLGADEGMNLHLLEFFGRKTAGLRDDVFGYSKLSDVVQQRCRVQSFEFRTGHAQFLCHFDGIDAHALQVLVGGVVLRFNRQRQRFNGSQMEIRHFLDVAFLVFQFAQVETIGAVDQVHSRHQQERRFPVELLVEPCDCSRYARADEVVRERPEVAIHQNSDERPALGQRNDHRDRTRIGNEIDCGRQSQQNRAAAHQRVRQRLVIDLVGKRRRYCTRAHIERQLYRLGPLRIQALRDHGDRTQNHSFGEAEFQDADQNEQKIHRQRAGNAWQVHLETRRQNRDT